MPPPVRPKQLQVAHGLAYRTASLTLGTNNTWENVPLTGGSDNRVNVSHDTGVNPSRLIADLAGVYLVRYAIHFHRGSGATAVPVAARLRKNGTTELVGSYAENVVANTTAGSLRRIEGHALVSLAAAEYVELQAQSAVVSNVNVTFPTTGLAAPTTKQVAHVSMTRIGA